MKTSRDVRVSQRGQMSLPAAARRRWRLDDGGDVGYLDLGDAILIVPHGVAQLRAQLLDALSEKDRAEMRSGFGDDDLACDTE